MALSIFEIKDFADYKRIAMQEKIFKVKIFIVMQKWTKSMKIFSLEIFRLYNNYMPAIATIFLLCTTKIFSLSLLYIAK